MFEIFEELCKESGKKPSVVARECGIDPSTISHWKKGLYTPKQDKLQKIADYFDVPLRYILTGKTEQESAAMDLLHHAVAQAGSTSPFLSNHGQMVWIDNDELYIIDTIHGWSEAQKKKLRKYVETINEYIGDQT